MEDKGYDHPIHSLELVTSLSSRPDDAGYGVPVPQGYLVTQRALRVRGAKLATQLVHDAVSSGLGVHGIHPAGFARFGLDADWAGNLSWWCGWLNQQDGARVTGQTDQVLDTGTRRYWQEQAKQVWAHAAVCARLAGVKDVVRGRAPRQRVALLDGLRELQVRVQARQQELQRWGYLAEHHAALAEVTAGLERQHRLLAERGWEQRGRSAGLAVVRGALVGDLSRLSQVAPHVVGPKIAKNAQIGQLLGRPGRAAARSRGTAIGTAAAAEPIR